MPWSDELDPLSPAFAIAADRARYIRVVAGPGTGKSFALKRRVARLLEEDSIDPRRILPVTFTNVAAEDLQRELMQVGVPGCENIRGSTLHSLGMRILSRANVLETTGRVARPLNRFEMDPLLYDLTNRFGTKRIRAKRIRAYEAAWARLQHEEPGHAQAADDREFEQELVSWLRFHEGMLIGEIVPQLYRYLRNNPAAPEKSAYTHVLVDEYQDLNKAEQSVVELLADTGELCIVGDDDQSLYSFKHAHPAGIRSFDEDHPGTSDHEVVECRRCPTRVVSMANALIAHNRDRDARSLEPFAANGQGEIHIVQYPTLAQESAGVAAFIHDQIANRGRRPEDILVLAQRRTIGNPIHDALGARNIPSKSYYIEGDLDSFSAQERLAVLSFLSIRRIGSPFDGCWVWEAPTFDAVRTRVSGHIARGQALHHSTPWYRSSGAKSLSHTLDISSNAFERYEALSPSLVGQIRLRNSLRSGCRTVWRGSMSLEALCSISCLEHRIPQSC